MAVRQRDPSRAQSPRLMSSAGFLVTQGSKENYSIKRNLKGTSGKPGNQVQFQDLKEEGVLE